MWKRISSLLIAASLIAASLVVAGCGSQENANSTGSANQGGKKVVRIAIMNSVAFLPMYLARDQGWIEDALKPYNVDVKWTEFTAGPPMNESFAAGQQDIGTIGDAVVSAIANGQDNKLIAITHGAPSYAIIVPGDSAVKSVGDLKGKKIGVALGTSAHNLVEKALAKNGLQTSDVTLVNVPYGDSESVLNNKNVDAVATWEPLVTQLEGKGNKIIASGADAGFKGTTELSVTSKFLTDNPDITKVILAQYYRAAREYEAHPDQYADQLAKDFGLDKPSLLKSAKKYDFAREFTDDDFAALQDVSHFLFSVKGIPSEIDVKPYITNDLIKQVIAEQNKN